MYYVDYSREERFTNAFNSMCK